MENVSHSLFSKGLLLVMVFLVAWTGNSLFGQFKKVYDPDSILVHNTSIFSAEKVLETDIPGKEILILGSLTTQDSGGVYRLGAYDMFSNLHGIPQAMHLFEDTSAFLFSGPKAYGGCYAGNGEFYIGVGTNGAQVVIKGNENGQMLWARQQRHHEFYSLHCDGSGVVVLGQDESIQGVHDFSLLSLHANGDFKYGNMFGTPDYESPERLLKVGDDYMMVGSQFDGIGFKAFVVKADSGLNLVWGRVLEIPGKSTYAKCLVKPVDGNGFIVSGTARGGIDTLYMLKLDELGIPEWSKYFVIQGATEATNIGLAMDPESGGYLFTGSYRKTGYLRPFIFKTDSIGNVEWAYDYGDPGNNTDEMLRDIIYCQADGYFYSVGNMVEVDSNLYLNKVIMVKIAADSGTIPCDSALAITSSNIGFVPGANAVEEPFQISSHYPIGNLFPVRMNLAERCTVIVGNTPGLPLTGTFQITNPTSGQLKVRVDVPMGGGTLRVHAMNGTLLLTESLAEGSQTMERDLSGLPSGLYLVSVEGEGWRYGTRRWALMK